MGSTESESKGLIYENATTMKEISESDYSVKEHYRSG